MATTEITGENFDELVQNNEIVIVDYWAEWCAPCKAFGPVFAAASEKYPDIVFGKCDVEANQDLAVRFEIRAIPTLQVYREQILIFSQPGMLPDAAFNELIGKIIELDMNEVREEIAKQSKDEDA
ncbi:MAG: thiol reductase thioredoxin [Deltaproteobacteria bacterium]|nr:thiol reductase thioredoxin [Deltaproteobacteria bacterium]